MSNPSDGPRPLIVKQEPSKEFSLFTRIGIILGLILLLYIPLLYLHSLVEERNERRETAVRDFSKIWGEQQLSGPILVIPYQLLRESISSEKKIIKNVERKNLIVLPETLDITGTATTESRYRSIYPIQSYTSNATISGNFVLGDEIHNFLIKNTMIVPLWNESFIALPFQDPKGIHAISPFQWGNQTVTMESGLGLTKLRTLTSQPYYNNEQTMTGFHAPIQLNRATASTNYDFTVTLNFNGIENISFLPLGKTSTFSFSSDWPHPNFTGAILPLSREITENGFSAQWKALHLSRGYPQFGAEDSWETNLGEYAASIRLVNPNSSYVKVERAIKYGLLFIGLTFVTLLSFELATKRRLHYVQYGIIGFALSLFYLTLLALSEHIPFALAYAISTIIITGMTASYTAWGLNKAKFGYIMAALLALLYGSLYFMLGLEDFALLMGTALVLIMLAILMFITRKLPTEEQATSTTETKPA